MKYFFKINKYILFGIFAVRELEKVRTNGPVTLDSSAAALLGSASELLLNTNTPTENGLSNGTSETTTVKVEPVFIDRPNNAGDHDDYTIAPKKAKVESD